MTRNYEYKLAYKEPPGSAIGEPLHELLQFTEYLLSTGQYEVIESLLSQFKIYKRSRFSIEQLRSFLIHLDYIFNFYDKSSCKYLIQLLTIIAKDQMLDTGLRLESNSKILQSAYEPFLELLLDVPLHDQHNRKKAYISQSTLNVKCKWLFTKNTIFQGYLQVLIINCVHKQNDWKNILSEIASTHPEQYFLAIFPFLERQQEAEKCISGSSILDLKRQFDLASENVELDPKIQQEFNLILLGLTDDFESFIRILYSVVPSEAESPVKDQKKIILDYDTRQIIFKQINMYQQNNLQSIHQIAILLKVISQMSSEIKNLFRESRCSISIRSVLQKPQKFQEEEKEEYIKSFKAIFFNHFDKQMVQIELSEALDNLIRNNIEHFPYIYTQLIISLDNSLLDSCLQKYIRQKYYSSSFDAQQLIHQFDKVVDYIIKATEIFPELLALAFFNQLFQKYDVLDQHCIKGFLECSQKQLQKCYIEYAKENEVKQHKNRQVKKPLYELMGLQKLIPENYIITELLDYALSITDQFPKLEIVKQQLLENPDLNNQWYLMLDNYKTQNNRAAIQHIQKIVKDIADSIIDQTILAEDIKKIKNLSQQKRAIFQQYLIRAFGYEVGLYKTPDFQNLIITAIISYDQAIVKLEWLQVLIEEYMKLSRDNKIQKEYRRYSQNFSKVQLIEIQQLPSTLVDLLQCAQQLFQVRYSTIFNNSFKTTVQDQPTQDMDVQQINEAFSISYNKFCEDIDFCLKEEIQQMPVSTVKQKLGQSSFSEQQIRNEIQVIKLIFRTPNQKCMRSLETLMNSFIEISSLEDICNGLINLNTMTIANESSQNGTQNIFNLKISKEIQIAQELLDYKKNLDKTTVGLYLNSYQKVKELIYDIIQYEVKHQDVQNIRQDGNQNKRLMTFEQACNTLKAFKSQSIGLIQFIKQISDEDLECWKDNVDDHEESGVETQTIFDCIALRDWICSVESQGRLRPIDLEMLIQIIVTSFNEDLRFQNLDQKISNCLAQLAAIKDLQKSKESNEEAKKIQIISIMRESKLTFTYEIVDTEIAWDLSLKYNKSTSGAHFDYEKIKELRDRAHLIQHTTKDQMKGNEQAFDELQQESQLLANFIDFSSSIKSVISQLSELYSYGYPIDMIDNFSSIHFKCKEGKCNGLSEFENKVKFTTQEWYKCILEELKSNYFMTFLSGQNIWIIERYLFDEQINKKEAIQASNIFQYMGKDPLYQHSSILQKPHEPTERLKLISLILREIPDKLSLELPQIEIKETKINIKSGEIPYLDIQLPFVGIITIFVKTGRPLPRADQLLFCHEKTSFQEILSFMYRCLKNEKGELHLIVKPEHLTLTNQDKLTELYKNITKFELRYDKNFNIGIVTTDQKSTFSGYMKQLENVRVINQHNHLSEDIIKEIVSSIDQTTIFVRSQSAGLGKSHFIRGLSIQSKAQLINFPIIGTLSYSDIGRRLAKVNHYKRAVLSIQISFVDQIDLLNEILINIALFRVLQTSNNIFIRPHEWKVCIELANTYDNIFETQIIYRKYLKNEEYIGSFELQHLMVNELADPKVNKLQYVCNHLLEAKNIKEIVAAGVYKIQQEHIEERKEPKQLISPLDASMRHIKTPSRESKTPRKSLIMEKLEKPTKMKKVVEESKIEENPLVPLLTEQCIDLLTEFFVKKQLENQQDPNFIQFSIFVRILSKLFSNFNKGGLFSKEMLQILVQDMKENGLKTDSKMMAEGIRSGILSAILMTVTEFTVKSINRNLRDQQNQANVQIKNYGQQSINIDTNTRQRIYREERKVADDIQNPLPQQIQELENQLQINLTWEKTNHFSVIFVEDGSPLFIYRDPTTVPIDMKKLIYIQSNYATTGQQLSQNINSGNLQILDYSSLQHYELREKLEMLKTQQVTDSFKRDYEYVLTTDNFLKMCIIYLKVQSGVPVVIMGETGCGKTTLIRYLCQNVRGETLITFNIHAGISAKEIIDKMNECEKQADLLSDNKMLWIFFDEFNTSENIGIISQILTEGTLLGRPLSKKMCFLAACNPYKLRSKKLRFDENVGIKRAIAQSRVNQNLLLYTVYPLPDSVIEYVWDFGALTDVDYCKYIRQMLLSSKIKNEIMLTAMLMKCHEFFSNREDSSSVSLRDVSRFIILQQWFKRSLKSKFEISKRKSDGSINKYKSNCEKYKIYIAEDYNQERELDINASLLALAHCYYLRLSSINDRMELIDYICSVKEVRNTINKDTIVNLLENEQNDYLARMELTGGIAVNKALKENIFAMIPCIINKIPVFICGKPGCSKSLACSLIFSNLRGKKSSEPYFQTLPELTMVSFQGSDSCTSDGIIKAYQKAEKFLKTENVLPVFVFDEIGLAELSRHNPLKVLHHMLEVENRRVGFVGISNWRLDASKMNRALYLARPDPDEYDLRLTAECIFDQIFPNSLIYKRIIQNLASAYFQLKQHYNQIKPEYADFYGLRDFYQLIKQVSIGLSQLNDPQQFDILSIVKVSIQRNFGGKIGAAHQMGQFFCQKNGNTDEFQDIPNTNVLDLIQQNISDKNSRYLMVICRSDVASYLLERQNRLNHAENAERRTLVGSVLENDIQKEDYSFRSLSDIILYIEKGIPIILKEMDHIYSSLYDLFNQNFSKYGEKRFCRIALGEKFNPRCFVHDDFHCIVFIDENNETLLKADAPFVNRFEKHYLDLDQILKPYQKAIVEDINDWVKKILTLRDQNKDMLLQPTSIFPGYSADTIGLLALQFSEVDQDNAEKIIMRCQESLIKMATQDILILTQISILNYVQT